MMVPTVAALKAGLGYPLARNYYKGHQRTEHKIYSKQDQV